MTGKEDRPVYEVLFIYDKKVNKKTEEKIIGPVRVRAETEIMAYIKAVLENYKELLEADLLTLTHKVKRF